MNKTKKITLGAMLLAIIGAVMFINRQLQILTVLLTMGIALVIIIYGTMYTFRDSAVLSFCLLILSFILGDPNTYIIVPPSILVGIGCSYGVSKGCKTQTLTLIAMVLFVVGELAVTFVLMPLLGIMSVSEQLSSLSIEFNELSNIYSQSGISVGSIFSSLTKPSFLMMMLIAATIFTGILEGYLLSILAKLLLKRLKIKEMGTLNIMNITMKPIVAYVLFILSAGGFYATAQIASGVESTLFYALLCAGMIPMMILIYYGYIYFIILAKLRFGRKSGLFVLLLVIFLFPISLYVLLIFGFLYGSGPLRNKIEKLIATKQNINI